VAPATTLSYVSTDEGDRGTTVLSSLVVALELARPGPSVKHVLEGLDHVIVGRGDTTSSERDRSAPVPTLRMLLGDPWMSSRHFELVRDGARWQLRDAGSKNGTLLNGERTPTATLADGDLIEAGGTCFLWRDREVAPGGLSQALSPTPGPGGLSSLSFALAHELAGLGRIARTDLSVLIGGETGTGKEVVARAVHTASGRRGQFIAVNCAALPATLIASELFGVKKGAFSGATEDRPGLLRAADGGTLLLDEIADLPETLQTVLLRVLQEREVTPVGDTRAIKVDVRVLAASHADLRARVAEGKFRNDLLARLAGFSLTLPPLRERREDLGRLVGELLARVAPQGGIRLERAAARALMSYHWPLNVRELEQALRSATALAAGGEIQLSHLPEAVRAARPQSPPVDAGEGGDTSKQPITQERMTALWTEHAGNVSALARALETSRSQVRRLLKRFGLAQGLAKDGSDSEGDE